MIAATTFAGKHVAVFGMGLSGVAAGRSLLAGGATVAAFDDSAGGLQTAANAGLTVEDLRAADWSKFQSLMLSPGVPLTHPEPHWIVELARAHGVEIIGDTEIFCRERRASGLTCPLIAITGTNGKSTTAALTHHLLRTAGLDAELGGNIGRAALDLAPFREERVYVLELSSFQLDLTPSLDADAAVLLNITPDHIDRHGNLANYAAVKAKILAHLDPGGLAVIGADDHESDVIASAAVKRGLSVARVSAVKPVRDGIFYRGGQLFLTLDGSAEEATAVGGIRSLRGDHNGQNAAAAMAVLAQCFRLNWDTLAEGLRSFPGLSHRMEEVSRHEHVIFINDSKATNADAAARALSSFDRIYWIAGGKAKEGGIESLRSYFPKIKKAYLIGEAAEAFQQTLGDAIPAVISGTLSRAVAEAAADALRDDPDGETAVLLSPACASYDQFRNFEERGDAFRTAVNALGLAASTAEQAA